MAIDIETIERTGAVQPVSPARPQRPEFDNERRENRQQEDRFARQDTIEIRGENGNRPNIELISPDGGLRSTVFDRSEALRSPQEQIQNDQRPDSARASFAGIAPDEIQQGLNTTGNSLNRDIQNLNALDDARDNSVNPTRSELAREVIDQDIGPREPLSPVNDPRAAAVREQTVQPGPAQRAPQIEAFDEGRAQRIDNNDDNTLAIQNERRDEEARLAASSERNEPPLAATAAETRRESAANAEAVKANNEAETAAAATVAEQSRDANQAANNQAREERQTRLAEDDAIAEAAETEAANAAIAGDGGETDSVSEEADSQQIEEQVQEEAAAGQLSGATPLSFGSDGSATFADGLGQRVNVAV